MDQTSNPVNPADIAATQQMLRQIASTDPNMRQFMAKLALDGQRVVLPVPYWSVVEFSAAPVAAVLTIDTTTRKAFQYALGNPMNIAGAAAGVNATFSDTNLLTQGQTLGNADVWIYGVSIEPLQGSEPAIIKALWDDAYIDISTDGTSSIRLGTPSMFPGAGGLFGSAQSGALLPPLNVNGPIDLGPGAQIGFFSNGNPMAGNFIRFPQPFKWGAVGSGSSDASLTIGMTLTRALALSIPANRAFAAGTTSAYTAPTTRGQPGTTARLRLRLVAQSVGRRGANV